MSQFLFAVEEYIESDGLSRDVGDAATIWAAPSSSDQVTEAEEKRTYRALDTGF